MRYEQAQPVGVRGCQAPAEVVDPYGGPVDLRVRFSETANLLTEPGLVLRLGEHVPAACLEVEAGCGSLRLALPLLSSLPLSGDHPSVVA